MTHYERLRRLEQWLTRDRRIARDRALSDLEVSRATLTRDIAFLRDRLHVPIAWDGDAEAWRLDPYDGIRYESRHFLDADEIQALLTMQQLLLRLDAGGLLAPHIEPLRRRLERMLGSAAPAESDVARRIRLLPANARRLHLPGFRAVGRALLERRRLSIRYRGRGRADSSERIVSPQRLVHYRDNWYLDAWCHWREALRSFSVDAIARAEVLDLAAIEMEDEELDDALGAGYGIFAGNEIRWARLRFTVERSRWVSAEVWHPNQRGHFDADGRWLLDLPYADPTELTMDILRHMPDVEALWPDDLRDMIRQRLEQALSASHRSG